MKYLGLPLLAWIILCSCGEEGAPVIPDNNGKILDYYIESFEFLDLGSNPQVKVVYDYDASGELTRYTVFGYSTDSQSLEEFSYFNFSRKNDRVDSIKGYFHEAVTPYIEYAYQYLADGRVSKITENNYAAGVNSEANFSYNPGSEIIKVAYTYSNGAGFNYEFDYSNGNILSDKTTRGSQLCSEGQYTYDQHVNPFNNLGYVDYTLTSLSVNNRLTESLDYVDCSFPSLVPEAYSYEYDSKGYPTAVTTFYKSDSDIKRSRREFFYR
jgi:hypothetical protein